MSHLDLSAPITFRQATIADIHDLAQLRWDFSLEDDHTGTETFDAFQRRFGRSVCADMRQRRCAIHVAEHASRLIANMYVKLIRKVPRPGRFGTRFGYMMNVYTAPEWRNQGVGSLLLDQVISWARTQSLEFLVLWPSERSVSFYQRHGFQPSGDALELAL